jgi:hypothetical protein
MPPRDPGTTMPKLDLTQAWDSGKLPAEDTLSEERAEPLPGDEADTANGRLLSTTGMFDPNTISRAEEEGRGAAFDILEHLEELERLLDETDESFPQNPNQ